MAESDSSSDGGSESSVESAESGDGGDAWGFVDRRLPEVLAFVAVIGAVVASPVEELVQRPGIWTVGRLFGGLAGAILFASRWSEGTTRRMLTGGAVVASVVALAALLGRNPAWHLSAFAHTNPTIWGMPSALPFAGLAAACLALLRRPESTLGRGVFAGSVLWSTAVVLMPHWWLMESSYPPSTALQLLEGSGGDALAGLVLFAMFLPVAGGWLAVSPVVFTGEGDNTEQFAASVPGLRLAVAGIGLLALHHLVAPLLVGEAVGARFVSGLLVVALLGLVAILGARWIIDWTDDALPDRPLELGDRALDIVIPAVIVILYGLLKTHGMGFSDTDENIYYYMAEDLAARGRWPYVDYFFAHPPLHVLIPAAFFKVFGYSHILAEQFSAWAGGISALAVWAIARRHIGRLGAAVAMIGLVFAAQWLKSTTVMTGVNLTIMFMVLGFWRSLDGKMISAGVLFGFAACTGVYAMAGICAALALAFFKDVRSGLEQLAAFAGVFGFINLVFWLAAGDAYIEGVYRYHALKAFDNPEMVPLFGEPKNPVSSLFNNIGALWGGDEFRKDLHYHPHLWLAGMLTPIAAAVAWCFDPERTRKLAAFFDVRRVWEDDQADGIGLWIALVGLALFVQFAMFRELYSFYFTLIYPTLALGLGYVVQKGFDFARRSIESNASVDWTGGLRLAHLASAVLVFGALSCWKPVGIEAGKVFESEVENAGDKNDYQWRPAVALPSLSGVVHALFWKDHRLKGNLQRGYNYYLWTKKRDFVTLPKIAKWVRENTEPDETIAGASTMAPLVALHANRRLALGEADTNSSRFKTGILDEAEYWDGICRDRIRVIVSTAGSYFHPRKLQNMPTIKSWFELADIVKDPELKYGRDFPIFLVKRVREPDEQGLVCRWEG